MIRTTRRAGGRRQRGAAAVEFAIVSLVAIPMMIFLIEMGRIMYAQNAASIATEAGARIVALCGPRYGGLQQAMRTYLPGLNPNDISVTSDCPAGGACTYTVSIDSSYQMSTLIPYLSRTFGISPTTQSTVTAEYSRVAGRGNPCN